MAKQRDVLLALGYYDHRFHMGVARYAREHGWHLTADMAYGRPIPWGWKGDGIVAKLTSRNDLARFVMGAKTPVVNVGRGIGRNTPLVLIDELPLVRLAVEHFISRGFGSFAWFGPYSTETTDPVGAPGVPIRGPAFVRELARADQTCHVMDWQRARGNKPDTWPAQRTWLIDQLQALPKPLALFCWDDSEAANAVQACRAAKIQVPEEIAILGVNNDELICEALPVPLSSIDTDMEGRAYQAAAVLDKLMAGRKPPPRTIMPPKCLVTRKSTDILAVPHVDLARALRFIWENFHRPISVPDIAQVAALSTRGLHKAFLRHLERSPLQEIHRVRLQHAMKLLRETENKIPAIATACGFESAKNIHRTFLQQAGMTPRQYRLKHSAKPVQ